MRAGPADRLPRTHLPTGPKDNRLASTPGQATLVEPQALNSAGGGHPLGHPAGRLPPNAGCPTGCPPLCIALNASTLLVSGARWPDSDVRRQPVSRNPGGLAPPQGPTL